jgi:hypothetical protein
MFLLLSSCGLLLPFFARFPLIKWTIFFLINILGQSFYPHFKRKVLILGSVWEEGFYLLA